MEKERIEKFRYQQRAKELEIAVTPFARREHLLPNR